MRSWKRACCVALSALMLMSNNTISAFANEVESDYVTNDIVRTTEEDVQKDPKGDIQNFLKELAQPIDAYYDGKHTFFKDEDIYTESDSDRLYYARVYKLELTKEDVEKNNTLFVSMYEEGLNYVVGRVCVFRESEDAVEKIASEYNSVTSKYLTAGTYYIAILAWTDPDNIEFEYGSVVSTHVAIGTVKDRNKMIQELEKEYTFDENPTKHFYEFPDADNLYMEEKKALPNYENVVKVRVPAKSILKVRNYRGSNEGNSSVGIFWEKAGEDGTYEESYSGYPNYVEQYFNEETICYVYVKANLFNTGRCTGYYEVSCESVPDIELDGLYITQESSSQNEAYWSWDAETKTLTLKDGFTAMGNIYVPSQTKIVVEGRAKIWSAGGVIYGESEISIVGNGRDVSKLEIACNGTAIGHSNRGDLNISDCTLDLYTYYGDAIHIYDGNMEFNNVDINIGTTYNGIYNYEYNADITYNNCNINIETDSKGMVVVDPLLTFNNCNVDIKSGDMGLFFRSYDYTEKHKLVVNGGTFYVTSGESVTDARRIEIHNADYELKAKNMVFKGILMDVDIDGKFQLKNAIGQQVYTGEYNEELRNFFEKCNGERDRVCYMKHIHTDKWNQDWEADEVTKADQNTDGAIEYGCNCGYQMGESIVIPKVGTISLNADSYTYDGKVKTPGVTVKDRTGAALVKDTDYSVSYDNGRVNVGTYKVTVTFTGKYSGSKELSFKIVPKTVTPTVTLSSASFVYDGKDKKPAVTVKIGNTVMPSTSYTVAYPADLKSIGTHKITVTLKGNYSGTKTVSYKIVPAKVTGLKQWTSEYSSTKIKMSWAKVTGAEGYAVYRSDSANGTYKLVKTTATTPVKNEYLKSGSKFYYKVRAYKTVNEAKVYGDYSDAVMMITKPGAPAVTLTAASKSAKITWTKSNGANGYEVYMSTKKDGTYTKIKTANSSTLSYTKTGLKSGQKYYIKVKAYMTVNGAKVYSGWSQIKAVTVK